MQLKLKHPFKFLYFVSFIFAIQYGLVLYINSSFLEQVVGEKTVGLVFTIASILSILVLLEMPRILNRFGNYRVAIFFVLANALFLTILSTGKSGLIVIIFFWLYTITNFCLILTRDVFIEEYTSKGEVGQTRGTFLTIINLALVFALSVAFIIVSKTSYMGVYLSSAFLTLSSLFFIFPHLKNFKDPIYKRISVHATLKKIWGNINLKKIYTTEFLLCFFYSWMIIYMPIYLHQYIGLSWKSIGLVLTIMLIPFILLDYPLGRLSDKIGEKKMLAFGFFVISLSTITIFFIKTPSVFVWALVLFCSRIGAATIEVMNESYFFKKINPSDAGLIAFFRNMFPLAFIIAPLLAILVLFLVPSFKYLFVVLSTVMLCGFLISLRLKDVK